MYIPLTWDNGPCGECIHWFKGEIAPFGITDVDLIIDAKQITKERLKNVNGVFIGGLVATYNVYTSVLHISDSLLVLILPLAVSSFNVIICKTFFKTTIPQSILESAEIDGASQMRTYFTIVLPISKPLLATIGILQSFSYWNDWFLSLMYINNPKLYSLQAVLMSVEKNIEFLAQNANTMGASVAAYATSMPKEPMRMAMAVIIVVPIACAYPFFQQYFVSGLTIGSVKE